MAPKRSAGRGKASDAAGDEAEVQGWKLSKCTDSHLLNQIESNLLQPQNVIHWRRSDGESSPNEGRNESVVFLPHVLRGFGFPISNLFRGLLHHWGGSSASLDPKFHSSHLYLHPSLQSFLGD